MQPFRRITSKVVPLLQDDIDTDQIVPARFLKSISRQGLAHALFANWRYHPDGSPRTDFVLNSPEYQNAQILLAARNFGTGSSREHAVWALQQYGFRVIIALSFGDIFYNNALKNGLLPVVLVPDDHDALVRYITQNPEAEITVDLEQQRVKLPDGKGFPFSIDPFTKTMLLQGMDELDYLLQQLPQIEAYESRRDERFLFPMEKGGAI